MHCIYCHQDSDEPCVLDALQEALDDIDDFGNRVEYGEVSEEEIAEALYAADDACYPDEDEDEDDDLGDEEARVYHFDRNGRTVRVTVDDPIAADVLESGEHRILAEDGDVVFVMAADYTHYEIFYRYSEE